jgi:hypothetical protein
MRSRQHFVRLEEYQRQCHGRPHHLLVVQYPWDLLNGDGHRWLGEELPCACGQVGCPLLTIGVLRASSVQARAEHVQTYSAQGKGSR